MLNKVRFAVVPALLLATSAWAADPTSPPPAAAGPPSLPAPIVVTGKNARTVDTFVRQAISTNDDRQLSRWNKPVCINVLNLDQPHADAITDRILTIGHAAGVQVASQPCIGDVLIVATQDAGDAIKQLHQLFPQLFRHLGNGDKPDGNFNDLLKPEPVRWIDATEQVSDDGVPFTDVHGDGAPHNEVRNPSLIRTSTREDTTLSVVVVDVNKLEGINTAQLADYLAMVVLGRPRFGARFAGDTILAMFTDRKAGSVLPAALTPMDMGLLKNLYSSENLRTADEQRHAIAYRLLHPKKDASPPTGDGTDG